MPRQGGRLEYVSMRKEVQFWERGMQVRGLGQSPMSGPQGELSSGRVEGEGDPGRAWERDMRVRVEMAVGGRIVVWDWELEWKLCWLRGWQLSEYRCGWL